MVCIPRYDRGYTLLGRSIYKIETLTTELDADGGGYQIPTDTTSLRRRRPDALGESPTLWSLLTTFILYHSSLRLSSVFQNFSTIKCYIYTTAERSFSLLHKLHGLRCYISAIRPICEVQYCLTWLYLCPST